MCMFLDFSYLHMRWKYIEKEVANKPTKHFNSYISIFIKKKKSARPFKITDQDINIRLIFPTKGLMLIKKTFDVI